MSLLERFEAGPAVVDATVHRLDNHGGIGLANWRELCAGLDIFDPEVTVNTY